MASQLVIAWNSGSAFAFLGANASQMVSIDIYWKCFPMPKAIQTPTSGRIKHRLMYSAMTMTTTSSVSTVLISTYFETCSTASLTCKNIRVSASSWVQTCIFREELDEMTTSLKIKSVYFVKFVWCGVKLSLLVLTWYDYYVLVGREGVSANLKSEELEQLFLVSCIAQKCS